MSGVRGVISSDFAPSNADARECWRLDAGGENACTLYLPQKKCPNRQTEPNNRAEFADCIDGTGALLSRQ